jgi:hypothetical protein
MRKIQITWVALLVGMLGCGVDRSGAADEAADHPAGEVESTPVPSEQDGCGEVEAWIEVHGLPSDYDEIVALPEQYRIGIFSAQTPDVQSSFMRTQVDRYRRSLTLTPEQRAVLDETFDLFSPELYAAGPDAPGVQAAERELERRSFAAFGPHLAGAILAHLGPLPPPRAAAATPPYCQCNTQSDWCWLTVGGTCKYVGNKCTWTGRGCGNGALLSCNGCCDGLSR